MAAGLTSTAAVRFSAQLRAKFPEVDVQPTLIFEFPTARAVTAHLDSEGAHSIYVLDMMAELISSRGSAEHTNQQRVADIFHILTSTTYFQTIGARFEFWQFEPGLSLT